MASPYGNPLTTVAAEAAALSKAGLGVPKRRTVYPDQGSRDYPLSDADRNSVEQYTPDVLGMANGTNVTALQRFLRAHGYNIAVDGKLGPQTKSAILDWHRGVGQRNPKEWSDRNIKVDDSHRSNNNASANNQINQPADSGNPMINRRGRDNTINTSETVKPPKTKGLGKGLLSNNTIDPKTLARSMVDAKYGPILGELMRSEKNLATQGSVNLSNIQDWYGSLSSNIVDRDKKSDAFDTQNLAAIEGIAPGVASAFGLAPGSEAATSIAASADVGSDTARMIMDSESDFANNMLSVTKLGGVNAKTAEQARQTQAMADLRGQRTDLLAAKGNDYNSAFMDAVQLKQGMESENLKNSIALFNAKMSALLAPTQMAGAAANLQGQLLGNTYKKAQINSLLNPQPKPKAKMSTNFVDLGNEKRYQLAGDITSGAQALQGTLDPRKNNSKQLVQFINGRLRMAGYKPQANRQVGNFAMEIARGLGINASPKWWGLG